MKLTGLQKKYPNAKHAPNPLCPSCCGYGAYPVEIVGYTRFVPCECIFFKGQHVATIRKLLGREKVTR